ncbi:MAG: MoaD/ThiS family protein [Bacteroidota bacterium]
MKIEVISFGKIAEFIERQQIVVENLSDTDDLKTLLEAKFPNLKNIKYRLAINKVLVQKNIELPESATVALMPPFSGG